MSVVDNAIYIDGKRAIEPDSLDNTFEALHSCPADGHSFGWIGMLRPDEAEIRAVAQEFGLHALAVEDTINAHQRPKLERYGDVLFVVLRPVRYVDHDEVVDIGELHLFLGPDFVITVRHAEEPDLGAVRARLEADPELLRQGPYAVLYAILGQDRRRLRTGAGGAADRHRRDRGAGLRRRPESVPAHLPALPRGDRVPARGRPARRPVRRAARTAQDACQRVRPRAAAATCATSPTTPPA